MKNLRFFLLLSFASSAWGPWQVVGGAEARREQPASLFATYGTNRVHYVLQGTGQKTLVFVHGWGGNTEFWREQVPALKSHARLVLVDLPGHGRSDKPKTAYTMDYFAGGVIAVMRDAKIEKATLIGHSMGTPVICRVYAKAPKTVAGLVAVDGLLRRPKGSPEQFESFVAPYRTPEYREHTARFVAAMFNHPGTEKLRDWTLQQVLATPQHVLSGAMDGMFQIGEPAWDLDHLDIPLMTIHAQSPMWTTEYETYVRSLSPKTSYDTLEGTGHFLMLEKPQEFNQRLIAALQKFALID